MRVRDLGLGRGRGGDDPDPRMMGALAALDAALAGEPTDPEHAELCEIALLVAAERPVAAAGELAALERAVDARFAPTPGTRTDPHGTTPSRRRPPGWRRSGAWGGAAAALAAGALAALVVALPGGGGSSSATSASSAASGAAAGSAASGAAAGTSSTASGIAAAKPLVHRPSARSGVLGPAPANGLNGTLGTTTPGGASSAAGASSGVATPYTAPGRQVVQGAQLTLAAPAARMDAAAQEVFNVVGAEGGIVQSSTVDSGGAANAYATFSLSIPSANLAQALRLLSTLRDAQVLSRTDTTSDITGTVGAAGMRLAEDRALRRALLAQLAAATTSAQVASLRAQLHGVDGQIAADTSKLNGLHRQVANSRVTVTIQPASPAPAPVHHNGSGFTLGRALHVAGRVLVVAAGVALIAVAVAIPLGLLAGLAAWVWAAVRRRRREAALDLL